MARRRQYHIDKEDIHRRYLAGESVWAIAQIYDLNKKQLTSLIKGWRNAEGRENWPYENKRALANNVRMIQPKLISNGCDLNGKQTLLQSKIGTMELNIVHYPNSAAKYGVERRLEGKCKMVVPITSLDGAIKIFNEFTRMYISETLQ